MQFKKKSSGRFYNQNAAPPDARRDRMTDIKMFYDKLTPINILEIGVFTLDFTVDLYNYFLNAKISCYDSLYDMHEYPEVFSYFLKNYNKIRDRTTVTLGLFQDPHVSICSYYDLTVIDVGSDSTNILEIIQKLPKSKNIFLLLPSSTETKVIQRNIVLDYLNTKK